jgi:hypothetical protein
MQMGRHASVWEAISFAVKEEHGLLGLFSGGKLVSQVVRDVPYAIITAVSYELLQAGVNNYMDARREEAVGVSGAAPSSSKSASGDTGNIGATEAKSLKSRRTYQDALCGSCAGGLSTFLTTPMDVVKTRLMSGGDQYGYTSVGDAARRMLSEEGGSSFFRGASSRLMHKIPANGLFYLCYEAFRVLLEVDEHYQ